MRTKLSISPSKNTPWLQWIGCLAAFLLACSIGLMLGWTSPYLARLTAEDSPLFITIEEASWVASILSLARIIGAILAAFSIEYFGSKRTMCLIGFPLLLSWISIILANSVIWLYVARLASGLSLGIAISSLPVYLGEVTSPKIRGAIVLLAFNGYDVGTTLGNVMGTYLSLSVFGWISLAPTVGAILLFHWMPESPHFLIRSKKLEDAKRSMLKYNPEINLKVEFDSLEKFVSTSSSLKFMNRLREFNVPQNRKCGMIVVALFTFTQASGVISFTFYEEIIITRGKFTAFAPAIVVIILTSIAIIAAFATTFLVDTWGRRVLWTIGCSGTFLSLIMVGVHFTLLEKGFDPVTLQWLLMFSLILWQIFTFVGPNPIPSIILSELSAPNIKSLVACLASLSASVSSFVFTKSYQPIIDAMGDAYVFWIHSAIVAVAVIFGLLLLPEMKGRSLQEIQDSLTKE